jgi:hypothetical protein
MTQTGANTDMVWLLVVIFSVIRHFWNSASGSQCLAPSYLISLLGCGFGVDCSTSPNSFPFKWPFSAPSFQSLSPPWLSSSLAHVPTESIKRQKCISRPWACFHHLKAAEGWVVKAHSCGSRLLVLAKASPGGSVICLTTASVLPTRTGCQVSRGLWVAI